MIGLWPTQNRLIIALRLAEKSAEESHPSPAFFKRIFSLFALLLPKSVPNALKIIKHWFDHTKNGFFFINAIETIFKEQKKIFENRALVTIISTRALVWGHRLHSNNNGRVACLVRTPGFRKVVMLACWLSQSLAPPVKINK